MASVSSLDKDLRNMRLSKYTPQAANEVREWIEEVLGERLAGGDLLEVLKDGVALCKLVNLAVPPPGVKYKSSSMPFVQMENVSHFLRACQLPPLNLPPHDVFLTVDLYEAKDPAQVLQCISSFSRIANTVQPSRFRRALGAKTKANAMSPQGTGSSSGGFGSSSGGYSRARGESTGSQSGTSTFNPAPRSIAAGTMSAGFPSGSSTPKTSLHGGTSSWSKKSDEGATSPAWNIHQYGYMGGASQGNQGIAFGARRQITSAAPVVPSLPDKERRRREEEAETERLRIQADEAEHKRRAQREAEEERAKIAEEQQWEEETRRHRERERQEADEEKRRWESEEARWRVDEEKKVKEEKEAEERLEKERQRKRAGSDAKLKGQFLSQYKAEQRIPQSSSSADIERTAERERVRELERQLEEAKAREQKYEMERQERIRHDRNRDRHKIEEHDMYMRQKEEDSHPPSHSQAVDHSHKFSNDSWREDEREFLRRQWKDNHPEPAATTNSPLQEGPPLPSRPLPEPTSSSVSMNTPVPSSRPLPDPVAYSTSNANRTDRFLASNPAPALEKPKTHYPFEIGMTSASEYDTEKQRREAAQTKTKAGGWASKSLLEREKERERQRQQEWEESQKATKDAVSRGVKEGGVGPGESWDVNQYGYTGGDNQNRGGVGFGGRRQIIGPRPRP
ncbi:MAG: hypothetical protein M1827_003710 [Pycnora praestabilis]|nr:MAG: hypothetical protein M1827_003710 [Pycnora praestabilis]